MRKYVMVFIVIITTIFILAGCKNKDEEPEKTKTVIEVWFHSGSGSDRDQLVRIFNTFNDSRKDIQVKLIELPEGKSYNEQVQAAAYGAAITGNLPDLLELDGPNTYNYIWSDFLIPLDAYISRELRNDLLESIIAQGTYQDGKLYSIGLFDSGMGIWGNKKYLDNAQIRIPTVKNPWTQKEFEDALEKLKKIKGIKYPLDLKLNYGITEFYTYAFSPILQSFGADLINRKDYQSARGVLNGPEAINAMSMVRSWIKKGYADLKPKDDLDFANGKSALSWVGFWVYEPYRKALGDNLILLPMPDFGKGAKTGMGSWCWGITKNCKNPKAAWEVLSFLLQPENIKSISEFSGGIPARKSVFNDVTLYSKSGPLRVYIEQIEAGYAVPRPITPAYPVITVAFAEAFNNIIHGSNVKAELDKAVKIIDTDIKSHGNYRLKK